MVRRARPEGSVIPVDRGSATGIEGSSGRASRTSSVTLRSVQPKVSVVGGGRMGTALVRGLLAAGWSSADLAVVELDAGRRAALEGELPGVAVSGAVSPSDGVIVAVKPDGAEPACRAVAAAGAGRVLSIMAGVSLGRLESWLAPATAVVRAMPNTPAMVGAGVAAIAPGSTADEAAMAWAEEILGAVGSVVRVPEQALDAVTGLSGSGPAYVFLLVEALAEAGVAVGLAPEVSLRLATGTLAGATRLLVESGEAPEALRAQVTSPGGTTEAGLRVLEERGVRVAVTAAVAAATARSRQMGQ
jgi:pyrroline-5-carboxylate reductase